MTQSPHATHPNAATLEKLYADFARGDAAAVLAACAEGFTFQIPGKSRLAGKYDRGTLASGLMTRLHELSGATFRFEAHDILASDRHGLVLGTVHLQRGGKPVEYRTVHVWRIEGGKPVAGYEYPRDLYQYDAVWS